jgi:hypothetical protein
MLLSDEADQFFFICGGEDFHECDPVHRPHDGYDISVNIGKILAVSSSGIVDGNGRVRGSRKFIDFSQYRVFAG